MRPAKFRRLRRLRILEAKIEAREIVFKVGPHQEYTSIQEAIDAVSGCLSRSGGITITCSIPFIREVVTIERGFENY